MTVQREIVVVCGTDGSYARPLSVMLRSAVDNLAQDCSLLAYVLYSEVSEEDRDRVRRSISDTRCTIRWISVDTSTIAGVPLWGRMPVSTYFKLFLTDLLPVEVTRAVWLDCDVLVCGDLAELWNTELGGYEAAAVQDQLVPLVSSRGGVARHRNLGIAADSKYFNAGVMVIDVAAWRTRHVTTKALDYLKRQWKSVVFWDQEGLNVALAGRWSELPPRWNYNVSLPFNRRPAGRASPMILHFAGMLKPWIYRTRDPEWSQYIEYLDRTAWRGMRPRRTLVALAVSLYERSGVRRVLHPLETIAMDAVRRMSRTPTPRDDVEFVSAMPAVND